MASPHQFATPQPVFPPRPRRRFTLAQANRALPLVRRIVADVVRSNHEAAQDQTRLETCTSAQQSAIQHSLQATLEHLQDYLDELADIGCELKDSRIGLIDFVGRHKGHDVYLCWKLGEEKIEHWHELQAGFMGRQPISTLDEKE